MMPGANKNKQTEGEKQREGAEMVLIWHVTNDLEPLL